MSTTISGRAAKVPSLQCLEQLGLSDLDSHFDLTQDSAWPEETIALWRRGISTRRTEVTRNGDTMSVRVFALATPEDLNLAYELLRVFNVEGPIDADDLGEHESLHELASFFDADAAYARAESGVRALKALIEAGRGPIGIPGPIRPLHIGERVLNEVELMDGKTEINVLNLLTKIQWEIDPKYEDAGIFESEPPSDNKNDGKWTIAIWLPNRNFIMPKVDRIAIQANQDEILMIPAKHAAEVGGEHWNLIDECQATVDALTGVEWEQLVSRARLFHGT